MHKVDRCCRAESCRTRLRGPIDPHPDADLKLPHPGAALMSAVIDSQRPIHFTPQGLVLLNYYHVQRSSLVPLTVNYLSTYYTEYKVCCSSVSFSAASQISFTPLLLENRLLSISAATWASTRSSSLLLQSR